MVLPQTWKTITINCWKIIKLIIKTPLIEAVLVPFFIVKDTHREKDPQIKLQRFWKVEIWTFEWLVHKINSLYEVFKLKQNFRNKWSSYGKTPFFAIDPFCTPHSIYLNIGFWQSSSVWKCYAFNLSTFN